MIFMLLETTTLTEVGRQFEYDYIYFDAILLVVWLSVVIHQKRFTALKAGIITAILVYSIDAIIWWNTSFGDGYLREYWIGGIQMPHPLGDYWALKFGADFMMTISYALYAFTWLWIMFEDWKERKWKSIALFTTLLSVNWMLTPYLSAWISWDETPVVCIRHMQSQFAVQIITVICGYLLMAILYSTSRFKSKSISTIGFIFLVGCFQSFVMEFPLWLAGIRPSGLDLLLYETIILANQGVPYLYVIQDKILPRFFKEK